MIPHWYHTTATPTTTSTNNNYQEPEDFFSASERQLLMSISYPLFGVSSSYNTTAIPTPALDRSIQLRLWIGLLDLLFANVNDHITTDGEPTVETAWAVSTLSITLSWLEDWLLDVLDTNTATTPTTAATATNDDDNDDTDAITSNDIYNSIHASLDELIQSVIQAFLRQVLIYPHLRSFSLGIVVWEHITSILVHQDSIRIVIRCLLQVRTILDRSDMYYWGSKLYIDPYLIRIQQLR
jgi:hypothetical protein